MPPGQKRTIPKSSPLLDEGNHARYILVVLYLVNSQIYFPYGCLMLVVSNYCCFIYSPNNMNIYEASCNSESDSLARTLPLKRGGPSTQLHPKRVQSRSVQQGGPCSSLTCAAWLQTGTGTYVEYIWIWIYIYDIIYECIWICWINTALNNWTLNLCNPL